MYTKDAGRHLIPVLNMWSLLNESVESWTEFYQMLHVVYGARLDVPENVTIFDRQKGLESAHEASMKHMGAFNCVKHLEGNVGAAVGQGMVTSFRKLAYAATKEIFISLWERHTPQSLKDYLGKIPREKWAKAYCTAQLGGHMSSQVFPTQQHIIARGVLNLSNSKRAIIRELKE